MEGFTVRSIEHRHHRERHRCEVLEAVKPKGRPAMLKVFVDPPIPGHVYDRATDVDILLLAPRHAGTSLHPKVSEWPCHVYMCVTDGGDEGGQTRILDWGLIEK